MPGDGKRMGFILEDLLLRRTLAPYSVLFVRGGGVGSSKSTRGTHKLLSTQIKCLDDHSLGGAVRAGYHSP